MFYPLIGYYSLPQLFYPTTIANDFFFFEAHILIVFRQANLYL